MSIRTGIPHLKTMKPSDYVKLTSDGFIHLNCLTEKTDGILLRIGYDDIGFFSQNSASGKEKMRNPEDYILRATKRSLETKKELKLTVPNAFAEIQEILLKNEKLQRYLKLYKADIFGELFCIELSKPSLIENERVFIGTSYNTNHMGKYGKFVIHKMIGDNFLYDLKKFSNSDLNFDDDLIKHPKRVIDVSNIDIEEASNIIDEEIKNMNLIPKWGSGTEGIIVHPDKEKDTPRFKVTSDVFREYRKTVNWK